MAGCVRAPSSASRFGAPSACRDRTLATPRCCQPCGTRHAAGGSNGSAAPAAGSARMNVTGGATHARAVSAPTAGWQRGSRLNALVMASNFRLFPVMSVPRAGSDVLGEGPCGSRRGISVRARALASRGEMATSSPPIRLYGKGMSVTDAVSDFVHEKVGHALLNYEQLVSHVDVNLSVRGQPAKNQTKGKEEHKVEVTLYTRHHVLIRAEESDGTLYEAIDFVSDKVRRKLRKAKEKKLAKYSRDRKDLRDRRNDILEEEEEHEREAQVDTTAEFARSWRKQLIRTKEFPMPPMSVNDAIEALDNIDHDWYMFRNKDTGEINVVYSRKSEGYGLVVPDGDQ